MQKFKWHLKFNQFHYFCITYPNKWAMCGNEFVFQLNTNFHCIPLHCSDGRIKVVGGNNIEGLLLSPKQLPFKNLKVCELIEIFILPLSFSLSCLHFKILVVLVSLGLTGSAFSFLYLHNVIAMFCRICCYWLFVSCTMPFIYFVFLYPHHRMILYSARIVYICHSPFA